jgi:hypothetical protein
LGRVGPGPAKPYRLAGPHALYAFRHHEIARVQPFQHFGDAAAPLSRADGDLLDRLPVPLRDDAIDE